MSCQQVSRQITTTTIPPPTPPPTTAATTSSKLITVTSAAVTTTAAAAAPTAAAAAAALIQPEAAIAVITPEDPYVFTESVPNKPPILFTAQKSRPRLAADTPNAIAAACHFSSGNHKLPLTTLNGNATKAVYFTAAAATSPPIGGSRQMVAATATTAIAATNLKQQQQSQIKRQIAVAATATAQLKRVSPNVCIVRPQQQQQQQQQLQLQQKQNHNPNQQQLQLKKQRQPSLDSAQPVLQHTPSLWQTPLLLEPAPAMPATTAVAAISPTVPKPAQKPLHGNVTTTPPPATALVSPLMQQQQQQPQLQQQQQATNGAAVSATLPPSRFHNTTLAQHLQKVECLKKPKKQTLPTNIIQTVATTTAASGDVLVATKLNATSAHIMPPLQAFEAPQHSVPDLNEIPVNVIFRKPQLGGPAAHNGANNHFVAQEQALLSAVHEEAALSGNMPIANATTAATITTTTLSTSPASQKKQKPPQDIVFAQPISKLSQNTCMNASTAITTAAPVTAPAAVAATAAMSSTPVHLATSAPLALLPTAIAGKMKKTSEKSATATQMATAVAATTTTLGTRKLSGYTKRKLLMGKTSVYKKGRKSLNAAIATVMMADGCGCGSGSGGGGCTTTTSDANQSNVNMRPVAVIKMCAKEVCMDTTLLSSPVALPYCLQRHWVGGLHGMRVSLEASATSAVTSSSSPSSSSSSSAAVTGREDRIELYKNQLRRQALQLLTIKPLQKLPLHEARRRLLCVDNLLHKYQNHRSSNNNNNSDIDAPVRKCSFEACFNQSLTLANYCQLHIVHNAEQQIFQACTAQCGADNAPCRLPVFHIASELPALCAKHTKATAGVDAMNCVRAEPPNALLHVVAQQAAVPVCEQLQFDTRKQQQQQQLSQTLQPQPQPQHQLQKQQQHHQQQQQHIPYETHAQIASAYKKATNGNEKPIQVRKRKIGSNPVGRPQKRARKSPVMHGATTTTPATGTITTTPLTTLPPLSAVLQRKSSTTSLESIASNSYSSSSQPATNAMATTTPSLINAGNNNNNNNVNNHNNSVLAPPALAPLSSYNGDGSGNVVNSNGFGVGVGNAFGNATATQSMLNFGASASIAADLKEHEFNEIVRQLAMVAHNNNNNNNNHYNHNNNNNNSNNNHHHHHNNHHHHHHQQHHHISFSSTNSNSNFTSVLGSTSSLPPSSSSADEFLTQDMLSICENSSPYASSEDTGLGGLSESELLSGSHDADEIPLGDTHLLEEHDLANVLSSLPVEAFSELFTAVRQDERDEVERALELADKHLKSLQQTIGSESDFLGDLLDVNDDILSNTDICSKMDITSPDTSNADTASLYFDNGSSVNTNASSSTGGGGNCTATVTDIRGLVQT